MFKQLKQSVAQAISSDPSYAYTIGDGDGTICGRSFLLQSKQAIARATGKKVTIFTAYMKRLLDICSAEEAVAVIHNLKQSVALLSQLRHPNVISVEAPVVEEKKKVWFVTERVEEVLYTDSLSKYPLQVKMLGLYQCAEAIQFIQEKAEVLVVNFALSSIYVTDSGRWKIGDLTHAVRRSQLGSSPPPRYPLSSVASPLLDYLPLEYVNYCTRGTGVACSIVPGTAPPLVFPDSDTYSFLVVTVEVITGRRLLLSGGDVQQLMQQLPAAEDAVGQLFPSGALRLPRPPIPTVIATGPFATPDMRTLVALSKFDSMESSERFRVLKGLYDGLTHRSFCEQIIMSTVIPLMIREGKVESNLRFVLPILLLCGACLCATNFKNSLREFFVSLFTAIVRAPTLERTAVYVEQLLEKREGIDAHFSSIEDRSTFIVPLLLKVIQCNGNARLQRGSLEWFCRVLRENPTVKLNLPNNVASQLLQASVFEPETLSLVFEALELILAFGPKEARLEMEEGIVSKLLSPTDVYSSPQIHRMMSLLGTVQRSMELEHRALKSIPLLCQLLLHSNMDVRKFAVTSITAFAQVFTDATAAPPPSVFAPLTSPSIHIAPNSRHPKNSTEEDLFAAFGLK